LETVSEKRDRDRENQNYRVKNFSSTRQNNVFDLSVFEVKKKQRRKLSFIQYNAHKRTYCREIIFFGILVLLKAKNMLDSEF